MSLDPPDTRRENLNKALGKTVVVCNRDGAAGLILLPLLIRVFPAIAVGGYKRHIQAAQMLPEKKK